MRKLLLLAGIGSFSLAWILASCGGSTNTVTSPPEDGGTDSTTSSSGDAQTEDVTTQDTGPSEDAGPAPCAPPSDPTKAAVCLGLVPEKITFVPANPSLDGRGTLVVQAFDTQVPDLADGGTLPALATIVLPGADAGAGAQIDLSQPVPVVRIDGLPAATVYVRAIFVDDPSPPKGLTAGDWLAGYDLSAGLYTGVPLKGEALTAGQGTSVSLDLRALRQMTVTLSLATTPAGNGQGPAQVYAIDSVYIGKGAHVFGIGKSACASVADGGTSDVVGFVLGKGPYYVTGWIDDFGDYEGGTLLGPGALAALDVEEDGGAQVPATDQITYAVDSYTAATTLPLSLVIAGDAGVDDVTCP